MLPWISNLGFGGQAAAEVARAVRVFSVVWRFFAADGTDLDHNGEPLFAATNSVGPHEILSADHTDTDPNDTPAEGDVLTFSGGVWVAAPPEAQESSGGDHLHGLTRWLADGVLTAFELLDFAEYLEFVVDDGAVVNSTIYSLSADRTQVVFDTAPVAASVVEAGYVIARI